MTLLAYIGTQGEGPGEGILALSLDATTGAMTALGVMAEEERPTFVLTDPRRPLLYAVSEVGNRDERCGAIMSYRIEDAGGRLASLGRRRTSGGPTHLVLNDAADKLYCANFGGPQAVALPVDRDGLLGPISAEVTTHGTGPHRRQTKPHPHGVTLSPDGRFLLVPDMGADRIFVYHVEAGALRPAAAPLPLPPGCGPRFVLFGADGTSLYMLAELSAELFHFRWEAETGALTLQGQISLDSQEPPAAPGAAAFGLSADGRFLYASNRGTHEMLVFALEAGTGTPTEIQRLPSGGEKPWGLGISPCGGWMLVANQASGLVASFRVDTGTGLLAPSGHSLEVQTPTSAAFVPGTVQAQLG